MKPADIPTLESRDSLGACAAQAVTAMIATGSPSLLAWLRFTELAVEHGPASVVCASFISELARQAIE